MQREDRSFSRIFVKNISIFFIIITFLVYIVILLLRISQGGFTLTEFYDKLMDSLLGIMLPIFLVNIAYEYFTKSYQSRETSEKVAETIILNKEIIDHFSTDVKERFIKNSTESILGKQEGEMLYETLIYPYLVNRYNFRKNFKYYIGYTRTNGRKTDNVAELPGQLAFGETDYHWVRQELSYDKKIKETGPDGQSIRVGFSFGESTLDSWLSEDGFFFRENLWLSEEHLELLRSYPAEMKKRFVKEILELELEIDQQKLEFELAENGTADGIVLQFHLPSGVVNEGGDSRRFRIKFKMPQLKSEKKFIVAIPEPTYRVDVLFSHYDDTVKLMYIPFFEGGESIGVLPNDAIKVELDKWVLPRSGIVFIWNEPAGGRSEQTGSTGPSRGKEYGNAV